MQLTNLVNSSSHIGQWRVKESRGPGTVLHISPRSPEKVAIALAQREPLRAKPLVAEILLNELVQSFYSSILEGFNVLIGAQHLVWFFKAKADSYCLLLESLKAVTLLTGQHLLTIKIPYN